MRLISNIAKSSLVVGALVLSARADTISFQVNQTLADWQTIFDTAMVDVSVAPKPPSATLTAFGPGFGDLSSALYSQDVQGGASSGAIITLLPKPGYSVTLESFDLAAFVGSSASTSYEVLDLPSNTDLIASTTLSLTYSASSHTTVNPNVSSASGLELIVGPDLFNAGLNNIVFSTKAVTATPDGGATLALLGLGGLGCFALRRKISA